LRLDQAGCEAEVADFVPSLEAGLARSPHRPAPQHLPLVLANALPRPCGLVLDETSAYVLVFSGRPATSGQLLRIDRESGLMNVLAPALRPDMLVADGDHIYWSELERGEIKRLAKQGGDVETLATGELLPTCLAVGDAGVYWATRRHQIMGVRAPGQAPRRIAELGAAATGLAVDGDDLLVALATGEMWRVTLDGVARQLFLTGQCFSRGFVVDARRVYWIDEEAGAVQSFAKRGGGSVRRLADAPAREGFLALTSEALVWSDADARSVQVLQRDGAHVVAASALPAPTELAACGDWIAWINRGDSSVMAVRV
jgi:hypothetical protein